MGACASTCRAWREDAENDEVKGAPPQQQQAQQAQHHHHWQHPAGPLPPLALPGGEPSTYVPLPTPLAIIGGPAIFVPSPDSKAAAAAAAAADGFQNGGDGVKRSPSEVQLFFRASQELSMAHLVRHPRLHPFHQGKTSRGGVGWGWRRKWGSFLDPACSYLPMYGGLARSAARRVSLHCERCAPVVLRTRPTPTCCWVVLRS